jgi:hypothetical protein
MQIDDQYVTSRLLVPFPENIAAHPDTAVFIHVGVPIGKLPCGTSAFLAPPGSGKARGPQGGRQRCDFGVFRPIPGHPTRQQTELLSLALSCLLARFSPHNSPDTLGGFSSRICAKGGEFSRFAHRVSRSPAATAQQESSFSRE